MLATAKPRSAHRPVGSFPFAVAITPNGAFAYVVNVGSFNVSVISTATNTVVATVGVPGNGPVGVDITPNGAFVYVTIQNSDTVAVIATATNTVVTTVPVGTSPVNLAIDPTGAFAYVPNLFSDNVSVISTATNTVVATIPVVGGPISIAFGVRTQGPTDKDQCKNGGWQTFTNPAFKNQGQCIKFVNHMDEGIH